LPLVEYHIHLRPVPENGDCLETRGHLDSYVRGDTPPCDSSMPQTCEVGDLSGKYGTVSGPDVKKEYVILFLFLEKGKTACFYVTNAQF